MLNKKSILIFSSIIFFTCNSNLAFAGRGRGTNRTRVRGGLVRRVKPPKSVQRKTKTTKKSAGKTVQSNSQAQKAKNLSPYEKCFNIYKNCMNPSCKVGQLDAACECSPDNAMGLTILENADSTCRMKSKFKEANCIKHEKEFYNSYSALMQNRCDAYKTQKEKEYANQLATQRMQKKLFIEKQNLNTDLYQDKVLKEMELQGYQKQIQNKEQMYSTQANTEIYNQKINEAMAQNASQTEAYVYEQKLNNERIKDNMRNNLKIQEGYYKQNMLDKAEINQKYRNDLQEVHEERMQHPELFAEFPKGISSNNNDPNERDNVIAPSNNNERDNVIAPSYDNGRDNVIAPGHQERIKDKQIYYKPTLEQMQMQQQQIQQNSPVHNYPNQNQTNNPNNPARY